MTEAEQNRLIVSHLHLCRMLASEFREIATDFDIAFEDLVSTANEALVRAGRNYDAQKGRFSIFASKWITGELKKLFEGREKYIPFGKPEEFERNFHEWDIWGSAAPYETWTSLAATPEDLAIAFDELRNQLDQFEHAYAYLPKRTRDILHARYLAQPQQTLNSIARDYAMPYQTLVDFINRTLKDMAEDIRNRRAA